MTYIGSGTRVITEITVTPRAASAGHTRKYCSDMKSIWLVLFSFFAAKNVEGWSKNVKYMPMGYEKEPECPEIPAKKPTSGFSVWMFLTSMALVTNIAANIANNANNNNNNVSYLFRYFFAKIKNTWPCLE